MAMPNIRILATGGTIAGSAGSATARGYKAGQIASSQMLEQANMLGLGAHLEAVDITSVGSQNIGWAEWQALHYHINEAMQ